MKYFLGIGLYNFNYVSSLCSITYFKYLEIPLFETLHMVTWIRHLVLVTFECFIHINAKTIINKNLGEKKYLYISN
jgi:hypothetical protein